MLSELFNFDIDVTQSLAISGWSNDRHIDCAATIDVMQSQGFVVHQLATDMLQSLTGLQYYIDRGSVRELHFDMRLATRFLSSGTLSQIERVAESCLCPIGIADDRIVLIADNGEAYLLHDQWFFLLKSHTFNGLLRFLFFADSSYCEDVPLQEILPE